MRDTERNRVLISSMSKAEKRSFKLYCSNQSGEKAYMNLFDLIERLPMEKYTEIEKAFEAENPDKRLETASNYLYRLLLNYLAQQRVERHMQSKLFNQVQKANILFDRKLISEAFDVLNEARRTADLYEDNLMQMLVCRTELYFQSTLGFPKCSEKQLVEKQMELLGNMKNSRAMNQYHFLNDILNHRLLHKGITSYEAKKEELNDLVLSELNMLANNPYGGFHAEKLHLLFQSTYYLEIGNYPSAVRNYKRLIELLEENTHLAQNPPIHLMNALDGVLDSLLSLCLYSDMLHFLIKLGQLDAPEFPADFAMKVRWLFYYYHASKLLHTGSFDEITSLQKSFEESLFKRSHLLPLDLQMHFFLTNTLLQLAQGRVKEAGREIRQVFAEGKLFQQFPLFRLVRLVNLLLKAELGDSQFIQSELAALRRGVQAERTSKTEKLVFRFVQSYPLPVFGKDRAQLWTYYQNKIKDIVGDKFERRILKHFNFVIYIESKLTGVPFAVLLGK